MTKNSFGLNIKPVNFLGINKSSSKRKPCPKAVREAVWRKYNGNKMNGRCYVCNAPITFTNFELGHNKAYSKGGKCTIGNLRPICRSCNRSMGTMSIEAFKKKYFSKKKPMKKKTVRKKTKRKVINPFSSIEFKF